MLQEVIMHVRESFPLTGLGVLVLPRLAAPLLLNYDLHTALEVKLIFPDGHEESAVATVEEVSHSLETYPEAEATTGRALLLTHPEATPVPAGTSVYILGEAY